MKQMLSKSFLVSLFIVCSCLSINGKEVIRILAIGNSFSVDAVEQYLYELAAANGDSLVIGNAYIGGCSLERHLKNATDDLEEYSYRKITGGVKTTHPSKVSIKYCVGDDDWDYITFQQASPYSGIDSSYRPLPALLDYVRRHAVNPDVKFLFHQTWAYAQNSTHEGFKNYGKDQYRMYESIVKTVARHAKKNNIKSIIPAGTAIQNGRTSFLGDTFCRDGYHLSETLGRYTAACVWLEVITGKSAVGNAYIPPGMTDKEALVAQQAAHYAVRRPKKVTSLAVLADGNTLTKTPGRVAFQELHGSFVNKDSCIGYKRRNIATKSAVIADRL